MQARSVTWRWTELRLLVPASLLVVLGFVISNAALAGTLDPGPLTLPVVYVALVAAAHVALMLAGHRGDQLLLPIVATLGGIGLVMLNRLPQDLAGTSAFGIQLGMASTQVVWIGVGLAVMVAAAIVLRDDRVLRHYKYSWAFVGILLLVATFLFGYEVNGARLWLDVGPLNVQPGEAIKVLLVVFIAGYLAEKRPLLAGAHYQIGPFALPPLPYLLPMVAMFVIVMLIVVISRDLGTALLFLGIFLTMLFVATGRRSYVVLGIVLFIAGSYVAYRMFGHVQVRIDNWIDPFADPSGRGYQPIQALYAFARGGLFGEGLGRGLPLIGGQLPIPALHTDFIFAAIAEELGLVGAFAVLGFYLALVFRGLRTAMLAHDDFDALLATGLTASIGIQTLIIVSGNAKLAPLTGITLPFVSYGGSSMIASFAVIGLLLAISHRGAVDAAPSGSR
ncbi:MAG: FtsW/RodA/SpoVE family cell cycle protein [Chloroflexota bacterium]|nr:FtsW/RodA/SpoVE family cell cycle protein [Chloroflexota bacterium]